MIVHLPHDAIDKERWNVLLAASPQRNWYARSEVLDAACPQWEALVDDDEGAIMPLPHRKKYGIRYVYQPFTLQQLGVFAPRTTPALSGRFLNAIPDRFKHADIYVNASSIEGAHPRWSFLEQHDQLIDISEPYERVSARFRSNHKRALKQCKADPCVERISVDDVIATIISSKQWTDWRIDPGQQRTMEAVMRLAAAEGYGWGSGVRVGGTLVAAAFWVEWEGRSIFLKSASLPAGRQVQAMHRIVDACIREHAGKGHIIDMAGSNDPGMSRFNAGFGASTSLYLRATMHRVPRILRSMVRSTHGH